MATSPNNLIVDELKEIEWSSVLEVGCDCGINLLEIKKVFPEKIIKGIDNEAQYSGLNYAGNIEKGKSNGLDIEKGDGRNLTFSDKSFDIVFCQAVLVMNPIEDFKKIISEMIRIAKKRVIFIEPHSEDAIKNGQYYGTGRILANYKFLEDLGYKPNFKKISTLIPNSI